MKRARLLRLQSLLLLALVIAVSSCTVKYVCPDGSEVLDSSLCSSADQPEPEQITTEKTSNLVPADVQELLDQRKDIASMFYNYKRFDQPLEAPLKFWVKGIMVKRELPIEKKVLNKNEMDVVIFNTVSRTANFYCESQKYCIKTGDIGSADYDQYYIKTPFDWAEEITSAEKTSEELVFNRKVWVLKTNQEISMWVDIFSGLPLRVDAGDKRHEFDIPVFNRVEDDDVKFTEKQDAYS
ncbi:MAG: hypothetical protein AABW53_00705 [Nanoarchaeota archaeon]